MQTDEDPFSERDLDLEAFFRDVKAGAEIKLTDADTGEVTIVPEVINEDTSRNANHTN